MTSVEGRRTKKGRSVPCGTVVSAEELQDDPITRDLQLEIKSKFVFLNKNLFFKIWS